MPANYDNSAWFYDRLSRLVYGRALVNTQLYLLQFIKPNSSVLIAGGGTGWVLEELCKLHPSGLNITYVEISANMMALSRKRDIRNNQVTFINQPVEQVTFQEKFDVIFTPFLFDNFLPENAKVIFDHLNNQIQADSIWLNCDFQLTGKWWQRLLLKSMLWFFRILCRIESRGLPEIDRLFIANNLQQVHQRTFFGEFVKAVVWRLEIS